VRRAARLAVLGVLLAAAGCRREPAGDPPSGPQSAPPPTLEVAGSRPQVGFDAEVELKARVTGSSDAWTITWRHVFGPAPRISKNQDGVLRLTTAPPPPPEQARAHAGPVLPLSAREAARVVFRAEATAGDLRLQQTVEVFPAFPTAAWPRVALRAIVYLPVPDPGAGRRWRAEEGRIAVGQTRFPHLDAARGLDVKWFGLVDPAGRPFRVRGGVWLGNRDCGRGDCHPREDQGWRGTAHATILKRALSGELPRTRGAYQDYCLACHTVGYQPGLENDGFGERAQLVGWRFPRELSPATWLDLPTALKDRAGVGCESCHSPGWFYTGYDDDICAQCHDHPPEYLTVAQGRRNKMSQAHNSLAGFAGNPVCQQCHVGQRYLESLRGHRSQSKPDLEVETAPHGVTCPICHDPHATACRRQLRLCGDVEVPGQTFDAGQGALCISCHTGEVDVVRGRLTRPFVPGTRSTRGTHGALQVEDAPARGRAPHAPQFQIVTGRGGKPLKLPDPPATGPLSPHMFVPDTCVGCHYDRTVRHRPAAGHTFKLLAEPAIEPTPTCGPRFDFGPLKRSPVTGTCVRCHGALDTLNVKASGDYDGDGAVRGTLDEIEALMGLLKRELDRQIAARGYRDRTGRRGASFTVAKEQIVVADERCQPLGAPDQPFGFPPADALLEKAAHNYLVIVRDGSGGLHNPPYVVKVLQGSIEELERTGGTVTRHPWKRP
jgi:hypothetical protein